MSTLADVQQSLAQQATNQLTNQALTSAAQIGVGALGAGMVGRGLLGVLQNLRRQRVTPRSTIPSPIEVEIPVEEIKEEEKVAGILDGAINSAADTVADFGKGEYASTPAGLPWSTPLWLSAGIGGLGAGWKLTDYLMDKRRKQHQQAEFEQAKKEYQDALYGKSAELLDQLFEVVEKQAAGPVMRAGAAANKALANSPQPGTPNPILGGPMKAIGVHSGSGGLFGPRNERPTGLPPKSVPGTITAVNRSQLQDAMQGRATPRARFSPATSDVAPGFLFADYDPALSQMFADPAGASFANAVQLRDRFGGTGSGDQFFQAAANTHGIAKALHSNQGPTSRQPLHGQVQRLPPEAVDVRQRSNKALREQQYPNPFGQGEANPFAPGPNDPRPAPRPSSLLQPAAGPSSAAPPAPNPFAGYEKASSEKQANVGKILSWLRGLRPSVAGRRAMFALRPAIRASYERAAIDAADGGWMKGLDSLKPPGIMRKTLDVLSGKNPTEEYAKTFRDVTRAASRAAEKQFRDSTSPSEYVRGFRTPWLGLTPQEVGRDAAKLQLGKNIFAGAGAGIVGGGVTAGTAAALSPKQASEDIKPNALAPGNLAGMAGGLAATWAGGSGLLAALSTYNAMKKRQRKSLLSAAQEQRRRQRYEAQPTPVYATPVPVSIMEAEEEDKPFRAAPSF